MCFEADPVQLAMVLPAPTFTFTLPSVHDGVQLDCRLYIPRQLKKAKDISHWHKRGAIVAHPYAPLGGCYDDPVVSFIGGELLRAGYVVGTFNFRGAGGSEGRTSWTAKSELADYVSVYGFMLVYLHRLRIGSASELNSTAENSVSNEEARLGDSGNSSAGVHLILGGYSYGSLIASHLPVVDVVADLFREAASSTAPYEISTIAEKIAALSEERIHRLTESRTPNRPGLTVEDLDQISRSTVSYLLVSPLLPPLSNFLTAFFRLSLGVGVESSAQGKPIPCPKPATQLCKHKTLAIYGNDDGFTSAKKLRKWSDELSLVPQSRFEYCEIDGAGHFWREDGVEEQARHVLQNWLDG